MKVEYYRQCLLRQDHENGSKTYITTWIPEVKSGIEIKPGISVRIEEHKDSKDRGWWIVESVSSYRQTEEQVRDRAHNWERSRRVSEA